LLNLKDGNVSCSVSYKVLPWKRAVKEMIVNHNYFVNHII
jgi:hypothetical protein